MNYETIVKNITKKKAIILVHLYGSYDFKIINF